MFLNLFSMLKLAFIVAVFFSVFLTDAIIIEKGGYSVFWKKEHHMPVAVVAF